VSAFSEIPVGEWVAIGRYRFTEGEILDFASLFDPQPFHLDAERARESLLGGLCASGWHTAAAFMRLNVDWQRAEGERLRAVGRPVPVFGPSPGVTDLRWLRPVRPGDTLVYRQRVAAKRASASRPGWGVLSTEVEAVQHGGSAHTEPVFTMRASVLVRTD